MRTTVDMKPEHRSALLARAARRGEKGLSSALEEAIESYLSREDWRQRRRQTVISLAGSISNANADDLRCITRKVREWLALILPIQTSSSITLPGVR